jgi:hypothetical protein
MKKFSSFPKVQGNMVEPRQNQVGLQTLAFIYSIAFNIVSINSILI